ncbi:helix-turn-helix transcriptional regulator [Streptomyces celluloflavus]
MGKVTTRYDGEREPGSEARADRSRPAVRPLRGREEELRLLCRALDRAQNSRRGTEGWLNGPAGIGRTRLLREAERAASARGFTVIRLKGEEFSPSVALGSLVHALTGPPDAERTPSAPGVTRETPDDRHLPAASLTLLDAHLKRSPLLITCDEGPAPSLTPALRPLMARLRNSPLVWLTARRTEREPAETAARTLARPPRDPPGTLRITLGPLSDDAVSQLFADRLGGPPDAELCTLLGLAQGNPRLLAAVCRQLLEHGGVRVESGTARLATEDGDATAEVRPPAAPRPVPRWFGALMDERLATVSPQTRLLMEVATVLGPACLPEDIAEMLGEPVGALVPRFREAVVAGMLQRGSDTVTFRHDLMRQALVADLPAVVRGAMHRQALGILMARGSSAAAVATHLIHGAHRGDPAMAGLLRRAAEESVTTTPRTAADLALRGLELVGPVVDEAHEPLTVIAVEACVRAGSLPTAVTLARDALIRPLDPETAARLRYWLSTALLLLGRTADCLDVAEELLAHPGAPAHLRQRAVLNQLAAWSAQDEARGVQHAERVLREAGDQELDIQAGVTTTLAVMRWRAGRLNEALSLCQEAAELADGGAAIEWHTHPRLMSAMMLAHTGRFAEAEAALGKAPHTVEFVSAGVPRLVRARLRLARGELDEAVREAAAGLAVAEQAGAGVLMPLAWLVLATVASYRGELAEAGEYARRLRDALPDDRGRVCAAAAAWIEAQIALASGGDQALETAVEELWTNECGRRALLIEEPAFAPWLVRLLLAGDRRTRAAAVSAAADRLARTNPGITAVRAAADHARGLVERDAAALESAAAHHRDAWVRASAAEDLGALLTDTSRALAAQHLESALARYGQLGAAGDTARVRRRLRAIGVRRRHWTRSDQPKTGWQSLTRTEHTVAEHVLQGMTNRQVAVRMFLSQHTVAFHLRQIFRKLGVHSRLELARYRQSTGHDGTPRAGGADR